MGIPVALATRAAVRAPVVYDARDIYVDAAQHRPAARAGPAAVRLARAAAGPVAPTGSHGQRRVRGRHRGPIRRGPTARPAQLLVPRSAPPTDDRKLPRALGLPGDRRIVLYHGGFSPRPRHRAAHRGHAAAVPDAVLVLLGYGAAAGATSRRGRARPGLAVASADPAGRCRRTSSCLGRLRRRRRDADPADDAQSPPDTSRTSCSRRWRPACPSSRRTCRAWRRSSARPAAASCRPDRSRRDCRRDPDRPRRATGATGRLA